ncbi:trihelix transcription factor ASIL2-like [Oryza brachyantha]|uniref:trihelix transcription factor ASIL2-like n=1 Tax=Oryza brachyantha TaxID=4533 RepID=UPI001ADC1C82|nr:trihelix transcription factor ASIL2-like [Oryza brachyantha]
MDGKPPPPNPNLPYREDCWSDGETAALVESWGSRYVELNRGSLRQPQWREVAEAVNTRPGASARRRPARTDIQCKNRVDTLKKKYKAERARGTPSSWYFYRHLDMLVGPTLSAAGASGGGGKKPSPPRALPMMRRRLESPSRSPSPPSPTPAVALPLPNYRQASNLPSAGLLFNKIAAAAAAESDSEDGYNIPNNNYEDDDDDASQQSASRSLSSRSGGAAAAGGGVSGSKRRKVGGGGFGELARAVETFSEMYERMEFAKQRHAEEMERQRIKFLKDLELKRMQAFVDVQLQLAKAKHRKHPDGASEMLMSLAALPFLSTPAYL